MNAGRFSKQEEEEIMKKTVNHSTAKGTIKLGKAKRLTRSSFDGDKNEIGDDRLYFIGG